MIALALLAQLLLPPSGDFPVTTAVEGRWTSQQGTYLGPGVGATLRTIESKERDIVSVKDFGAVGDGVADDTAAIQAAINSGGSGPVAVEMPATANGYKLSSLLTLAKNSTLRIRGGGTITVAGIRVPDSLTDNTGVSGIECPEGAKIKLANSTNVDLIANTNFATLSGTGNAFGTFKFMLAGCILDGNKANQTALVTTTAGTITNVARSAGGVVTITMSGATTPTMAAGMTVNIGGLTNDNSSFNGRFVVQSGGNPFTYNQTLRNTVASTGATGSGTAIGYSGSNGVRIFGRAGRFTSLTVANNVLDGMWHEGYTPIAFTDDSTELETVFRSVRLINSGGDGLVFWGPQASRAMDSVGYNHGQWGRELFQTLFDTHTVSYLNTSGSLHIGSGGAIQQIGSQETSASGWGILVDSGTGPSTFAGGTVGCLGCVGIEFRSPNHSYQGLVQNNGTGVKFNGGGAILNVAMATNTTWFDCTSENGQVIIDVYSNDNSGTMKGTSCWTGTEWLRLPALAGNTVRFQEPGAGNGFFIAGWNPTFPPNNGTIAELNLAQSWTAAQTFSSADNKGSVALSGGTKAVTVGASGVTVCTCNDTTTITNPCKGTISGTTLTLTGTGTDTVSYLCL